MMTPTVSSNEKQSYTMYRQPIPTDRLCMYDVSPSEASGTSILFWNLESLMSDRTIYMV